MSAGAKLPVHVHVAVHIHVHVHVQMSTWVKCTEILCGPIHAHPLHPPHHPFTVDIPAAGEHLIVHTCT